MTYDGKTPDQMSLEELEGALVYCYRHMKQAEKVYSLNKAAIVEISEELATRPEYAEKTLN